MPTLEEMYVENLEDNGGSAIEWLSYFLTKMTTDQRRKYMSCPQQFMEWYLDEGGISASSLGTSAPKSEASCKQWLDENVVL